MFNRWFRKRAPEVCSQLTLIGQNGTNRRIVLETSEIIEAPTWTPDGNWLVFNGGGRLFRLPADGSGQPEEIDTGDVFGATNDHLVSPDGKTVYFTADGRIHAVPLQGGQAHSVTMNRPGQPPMDSYLHGISPDGKTLIFVGVTSGERTNAQSICTLDVQTGTVAVLTHRMTAVDGPEFSPDGRWTYFNAIPNVSRKGHSQIFRMRSNGDQPEQLTFDSRVNWFPHPSPDGRWLMYLSYPERTQGHPANQEVILRMIPTSGGTPKDVVTLQGGQGTTNANGWAPDSQHFAYMAYPLKTALT